MSIIKTIVITILSIMTIKNNNSNSNTRMRRRSRRRINIGNDKRRKYGNNMNSNHILEKTSDKNDEK